ncbi:hypothetical protein [Arsenicicoccus dermatophilus]|nr:hypothetical protein [Arsenicicoccus dermatophilus]MCH8611806.1 hypothetical protein [Arsenicicoccus dermatophilus]
MPGIVSAETGSHGDRSHLVHDGQVAVVDPQRDIDRVGDLARTPGKES